jgi:hypothetical protein
MPAPGASESPLHAHDDAQCFSSAESTAANGCPITASVTTISCAGFSTYMSSGPPYRLSVHLSYSTILFALPLVFPSTTEPHDSSDSVVQPAGGVTHWYSPHTLPALHCVSFVHSGGSANSERSYPPTPRSGE